MKQKKSHKITNIFPTYSSHVLARHGTAVQRLPSSHCCGKSCVLLITDHSYIQCSAKSAKNVVNILFDSIHQPVGGAAQVMINRLQRRHDS